MNGATWTGLLAVVVILVANRLLQGAWVVPRGTPLGQALQELKGLLVTITLLLLAKLKAHVRLS